MNKHLLMISMHLPIHLSNMSGFDGHVVETINTTIAKIE
jgi:hypothetical protein